MLSDMVRPERKARQSRNTTRASRFILVDRNPCSDLLTGPRGRIVWPVGDGDDWAAVSQACELRSIAIRPVTGTPAPIRRTRGAVCGIGGAEVAAVARLYAHLTGRDYRVHAPSDLPGDAVVVTTFGQLTSDLLHRLYSEAKSDAAIGLICAADARQLRRQALVRALFAAYPAIDATAPWRAVFPTVPSASQGHGDLQVFGGASPAAEIRSALAARSGLLAIATHSDGVDAMLGPSLALCGVRGEHLAAPLPREPSCLANDFCHRFGVPVAGVGALDAVIRPESLSADVMLFDTCFGTLAADAPINIARGLGGRLLENVAIGALVTTWELTVLDPAKLQGLVADLRAGLTLGRAVARFNRSGVARQTAARLAVFGDPRTRFEKRSAAAGRMKRGAGTIGVRDSVKLPAMLGELGFSRACLQRGIADLSAQQESCGPALAPQLRRQRDVSERALGLLRKFELSHWLAAPVAAADAGLEEELRRALIDDAFVRRPLDDWKAFADKTTWTHCKCAGCAAPSWVGVLGLRVTGVSRRRVVLCPRCGLSEDMPAHVRLQLQVDAASGTCTLSGNPPRRAWSGALILRTRIEARDRKWDWPIAPDGGPSDRMQIPEPLPAGPVRLAVIMAHGGWLAWMGTDVPGGPAQ